MKALFWDRDGTLIEHFPKGKYTVLPKHIELKPYFEELKELNEYFVFFILTNAGGIGRGYFSPEQFWEGQRCFEKQAEAFGVKFEKCYPAFWNPQAPKNYPELKFFRKPSLQSFFEIKKSYPTIEIEDSWFIGDSVVDMETAGKIGCKKILIKNEKDPKKYNFSEKSNPDFMAHNLKEVAEFLKSHCLEVSP